MNTVTLVNTGDFATRVLFFFFFVNVGGFNMETVINITCIVLSASSDYLIHLHGGKAYRSSQLWELGEIPHKLVVSHLPMLISSSVSASPMHSNWKSWRDCENFCTAAERSAKKETFLYQCICHHSRLSSYILTVKHSYKLKKNTMIFMHSTNNSFWMGTVELTRVEPDTVFCCCGPRFCTLYCLRCFSAHHRCKEWLLLSYL